MKSQSSSPDLRCFAVFASGQTRQRLSLIKFGNSSWTCLGNMPPLDGKSAYIIAAVATCLKFEAHGVRAFFVIAVSCFGGSGFFSGSSAISAELRKSAIQTRL